MELAQPTCSTGSISVPVLTDKKLNDNKQYLVRLKSIKVYKIIIINEKHS